jgi:hypothetical protein
MVSAAASTFWGAVDTAGPPGLDQRPRAGIQPLDQLGRILDRVLAAPGIPPSRRPHLRALALLWHDHPDAAHQLVQEREGDQDADYLHALLHRREGDYGNAAYWFAEVGDHPVYPALAEAARSLGLAALVRDGAWSPKAMIDAVGRACAGKADAAPLVACQDREFRILAAHLLAE